jgi:hypothetical protein
MGVEELLDNRGVYSQEGTAVGELELYGKLGVWLNGSAVDCCHIPTNYTK